MSLNQRKSYSVSFSDERLPWLIVQTNVELFKPLIQKDL